MTSADVVERLITAWHYWDRHRTSRHAVVELHHAIDALSLPRNQVLEIVAAARRSTIDDDGHPTHHGMSIPDAIQTAINQLAPREVA